MDIYKKNVLNVANGHETSKSENTNEEENAEYIFCQEKFLNSAGNEKMVHCMSCSKWVYEKFGGFDPVINNDFTCDFCSI
jgi:hypothetical protein